MEKQKANQKAQLNSLMKDNSEFNKDGSRNFLSNLKSATKNPLTTRSNPSSTSNSYKTPMYPMFSSELSQIIKDNQNDSTSAPLPSTSKTMNSSFTSDVSYSKQKQSDAPSVPSTIPGQHTRFADMSSSQKLSIQSMINKKLSAISNNSRKSSTSVVSLTAQSEHHETKESDAPPPPSNPVANDQSSSAVPSKSNYTGLKKRKLALNSKPSSHSSAVHENKMEETIQPAKQPNAYVPKRSLLPVYDLYYFCFMH